VRALHARGITLRGIGRTVLVLAALAAVAWMFWFSWSALLPFQIGVVLAYLTLPLVNRLENSMPRWLAIVVVYTGGLLLVVGAVAIIVPTVVNQANEAIEALPSLDELQQQTAEIFLVLETYRESLPERLRTPIENAIGDAFRQAQGNLTDYIQGVLTLLVTSTLGLINTVTFVLGFVIVPVWLFYVIKDQRAASKALDHALPNWMRPDFWSIIIIIDRVFSSYIRGQLVLGLVVGTAAWLGLNLLNLAGFEVRYTLLLGVIAGFTELIPIIGPVIGAIPAIAVGLFDSPTTALAVTVLYILIQQLENTILVPRIVGDSVGIHPAVLMVLIVIASQVFGFLGIILAAPLAAVVRDIFRYVYGRLSEPPLPAGLLPGEAPNEPPEAITPEQAPSFAERDDAAAMPHSSAIIDREQHPS
jgi:predicted PurR-regulated permease PerM